MRKKFYEILFKISYLVYLIRFNRYKVIVNKFSSLFNKKSNIDENLLISSFFVSHFHPNISRIFIDIGSNTGSSIKPFSSKKFCNWKIYGFEPEKNIFYLLKLRTKPFYNVFVSDLCVSDRNQFDVPFYLSEKSSGISSLLNFDTSHKEKIYVNTIKLDDFLHKKKIGKIDYLKIDTEGFDLSILESFSFKQFKPEIIMSEFDHNKKGTYRYNDLISIYKKNNYECLVFEWYPVTKEDYGGIHKFKKFHESPYNEIDDNAWGNVIAFKSRLLKNKFLEHISKKV